MPIPIIGAGIIAARAAGAAKIATRIAGGIKNSKTVSKDYAEGNAFPISHVKVVKTQQQINAEGLAAGRAAMGKPVTKTTQEIAQETSKENARLILAKSRIKRGK